MSRNVFVFAWQAAALRAPMHVTNALRWLPTFPLPENLPQPLEKRSDGSFVYDELAWTHVAERVRPALQTNVEVVFRDKIQLCRGCGWDLVTDVARPTVSYIRNNLKLDFFVADAGAMSFL